MKLGFTGTQNGINEFQMNELVKYFDKFNPVELHHGDCIGADQQCHFKFLNWHIAHDTEDRKIVIHPPTNSQKMARTWMYDQYPQILKEKLSICKFKIELVMKEPFAYLARNQDIVRDTDVLIACPKEIEHTLRSGTWATIRYGWHQHKEVIVIPPILITKGKE